MIEEALSHHDQGAKEEEEETRIPQFSFNSLKSSVLQPPPYPTSLRFHHIPTILL
jgi:hypothetical protein